MPPAAGPQLCSRLEAVGAGTILVNRTPLLIPSARPKQRLVSAEQCGFSSALQNYRVAKRRALSFCCCAATNTTQADAVAQVLQAVKARLKRRMPFSCFTASTSFIKTSKFKPEFRRIGYRAGSLDLSRAEAANIASRGRPCKVMQSGKHY